MRTAPKLSIIAVAAALASCGGTSTVSNTSPLGSEDGGKPDGIAAVTSGDTVTVTMGPFTIPPSSEVFKCQNFANPFGNVDQDINEYETHMTAGSHHMFLFYNERNEDSEIEDCPAGGFEFHAYPFSTQVRDASLKYPDGVGSLIPSGMGFRVNAHYVNPGATPMTGTVTAVLHKAPAGTVQQHAGVIFMNDGRIKVPPGGATSAASCSLPGNINIMAAASHMHQRAKGFTAKTTEGTMLYETTEWADPPPRVFTPVLAIPKKTMVNFGCSYDNETASTLSFGEFAQSSVMCILTMHYYPVADPKHPTLDCQKF